MDQLLDFRDLTSFLFLYWRNNFKGTFTAPSHQELIVLCYCCVFSCILCPFIRATVCWIPTNVFGSCRHWSSQLRHKFLGIESYFNDVVEQSKERSQGEGCHEQCHKTKLDDWTLKKTEEYTWKLLLTVSLLSVI